MRTQRWVAAVFGASVTMIIVSLFLPWIERGSGSTLSPIDIMRITFDGSIERFAQPFLAGSVLAVAVSCAVQLFALSSRPPMRLVIVCAVTLNDVLIILALARLSAASRSWASGSWLAIAGSCLAFIGLIGLFFSDRGTNEDQSVSPFDSSAMGVHSH